MKRNTTIIGVLLPFTLATGGCGAGSAELPAIKGNVGEAPSMGGGGTQPEGVLSEMVIEGDGSKVGANDLLVAEITSFPREEGEEPGTEPSFSSHDLDTEVLLSMPEFAAASAARARRPGRSGVRRRPRARRPARAGVCSGPGAHRSARAAPARGGLQS
ncbi:hypothetical protein ACFQXA_31905 [Nocardiopsis composta]